MMDAATLVKVATALTAIARIVETLGPWGLLGLALAGPVVLLVAILGLSYWHGLKQAAALHVFRATTDTMLAAYQNDTRKLFDDHRLRLDDVLAQYGGALDEHGKALRETAQYYRDNVELVKSWQRIADGFQDVVVSNTRTLERLCGDIEHHVFCPAARDQKGLR